MTKNSVTIGGRRMSERFFNRGKWARYALLTMISMTSASHADAPSANPKEALMLRRITEYWKDGDYATVKRQIVNFIENNPDTALYDHLSAMLGDLYFQEKNFRQALNTYDLIANPEIREKTFFNHLQAQFEMRDYLAVIEKAEKYFKQHPNDRSEQPVKIRYLLAESCFRYALKSSDMEKKAQYLKIAKPHYKILSQTKYSDRVLFPLAEIHRLLREDGRAAALYLKLADKYPEHRERFLFQAGILQIKENKQEAIHTFYKVHEMGGKRSRLAAFNRLILLYQSENYEGFLSFYDSVIKLMPEQKVPLLQFYEGRCFYNLGDYNGAVLPLENFVTATKGRSKELKTALLLLVNCSRYMKDTALLEKTLLSYKNTFPKDAEVPKILVVHSHMCRETGQLSQALNDLKTILADYPSFDQIEGVMYDYALILSQNDRFMEAREAFLSFLDKYPTSSRKAAAWRHLLNCSIEEIKDPSQHNSLESKEIFVKILQKALEQDKILTQNEKQQYGLVLLKCKCELQQYEEVIPSLDHFIADTMDKELLSEAHLLMALCQQKATSDINPFIQHAETALSYNPKLPEHDLLHLELYNAYLSKGQSAEDEGNKDYFFNQAANHLFTSEAWKERSIKLDNHLWLANYFYQDAKQGDQEAFKKAQLLYDNLLGVDDNTETLNISSDSLFLEAEVLKYAHLLDLMGEKKQKVALMERLVRKQEQHPQLPWKMKRRALLELAKAYESVHSFENALGSYRCLTQAKERVSSMVTSTAKLHLAKLEYQLMKPQSRVSDNPEMISILHTLKDLQIQKKLRAEPLHLEAALQYAEIRSSFSDPKALPQNAHFFLKRMRDDFFNKEDPIAEEYNYLRNELPEKNAIFTAYMNYLDAQMLIYEGFMARQEKKLDKADQCEEEALAILDNLLEKEDVLKPYLLDRVKHTKMEAKQRQ